MHFCRYGPFEFDPGHSRFLAPKKTGCAKIPCHVKTPRPFRNIFIVSHMFCHMVDPGVSQVRLEAFCGVSRSILKMLPSWDGLVEILLHLLDLLQCLNWEAVYYPIPRNIPLKMPSKGILYKRSCIYIDILHILYFFHLFTDIRILIYIYICIYWSDLGGQTVGPLLTVASSLEGWFVSYTLSHEVSSKVVWKNQPKEFFYDLLVDKEILPAETLAQMQETFFRVKTSCIFDGQLRCFCTTKMNQLASKLLHCFVMSFSNRGPRVNYANKLQ